MPRHTHARRGERFPLTGPLVRLDDEGRVRLSAALWAPESQAHRYISLSPGAAYELGRELVDTAESALMAETWPLSALPRVPVGGPARVAAQPGSPAIRPAGAVESRG